MARDPGLVLAEAPALPSEDGIRRHDDQRPPPAGPDSGKAGPEQTVGTTELRGGTPGAYRRRAAGAGPILEGELAMATDEEGEKPEQVE
jgi:hypothetical protein